MLEQIEKGRIPMKKTVRIQFKPDSNPLIVSSMFDSGNMDKVQIGLNNSIIITPANDCSGTSYQSHAKGWFYFSVTGGSGKLKIVIKKLAQLSSQMKISQYFRPVYRYQKQNWNRVENAKTIMKEDDTQLHIQFQFMKNMTVYFAYTYPFSYQECENLLEKIDKQTKKHKSIHYSDEILIKSPEGRNVHLLTLTSNDGKDDQFIDNEFDNAYLFPENKGKTLRVPHDKKVVIISARVHPSEAPSSHTFNGLLNFLISKDARAFFLRKNFVFKLVPMLNPDGVSNGHHRMDVFNQNLNRFYQNPDPLLQPSVFAVKKIGQHYRNQNKLCFYLDLHAHPQKKGNFIYGNAFQNPQSQVQTQLFAKILSLNCIQFDYQNSSFDQKHMTLKDKNEGLTKQGCGRVVFQKQLNQIYSYTMECGYTCSNYLNQIVSIDKGHRKFQKHGIMTDQFQNIKSTYYSGGKKNLNFTIQSYQALGKAICVSILDLFSLNPASRVPNSQFKTLEGIKKEISFQIQKTSNPNNFKRYYMKPSSQQTIKLADQLNSSKTINSVGAIKLKPSMQKRTLLITSQFMFLQNKSLGQKDRKIQSSTNRQKIKNPTLPKVNLFKINNFPKNMILLTKKLSQKP